MPVLQVQEKLIDYKGPPLEPKPPPPIPREESARYRYPEQLMAPVHIHPTGLIDTFKLGYALQLEEDAARFMYPFVPKDTPEPVRRDYIYGGVAPGTGAGSVGYGPARQQYGHQYLAGGAGRGYGRDLVPGENLKSVTKKEGEASKRLKVRPVSPRAVDSSGCRSGGCCIFVQDVQVESFYPGGLDGVLRERSVAHYCGIAIISCHFPSRIRSPFARV